MPITIKNLCIVFFYLTFAASTQAQNQNKKSLEESWIAKNLADSGKFILSSTTSRIWGCAPIYDDEGKVHVFFSTWALDGHWLKNSKIAHAVADHPEGPYKVLGTILEGRGQGYWDAHSIHNPSIYRVDGKYVLLYIGNDTTKEETWRERAAAANTQKIGLATADTPYGPWERGDKPLLDVSTDTTTWDSYCVVNPAFIHHPNGEYWLYYRAWDRNHDDRRKTGLAISKSLKGPYVRHENNPIIDFPEYGGQTEDPYMFYYEGKFHCLIRDMGNFDWLGGLYLSSEDGVNWSAYKRGYYKGATYFPVTEKKRFERVQVLFKNGHPTYLFNAIQRNNGLSSGAVLKINR